MKKLINQFKAPLACLILFGALAAALPAFAFKDAQPTLNASSFKTGGSVIRTSKPSEIKQKARAKGLRIIGENKLPGKEVLLSVDGAISSTAVRLLELENRHEDIEISPNYTYRLALTPNDTKYSDQWNLAKISAPAAWDITTGSNTVTIAVIDTGALFSQSWGSLGPFTQPDFPDSKKWTNSGEVGITVNEGATPNCTSRSLTLDKYCNNLDDDGNGYIDDWQGWDFMGGFRGNSGCPNFNDPDTYEYSGTDTLLIGLVMQDSDPQPYSCDDFNDKTQLNKTHYDPTLPADERCDYGAGACYIGHGTIVGSTATAASNNSQLIAGVDWGAKLMNLRVIDGYGFTTTARVTTAIEYAVAMNADVINLSLAVYNPGGSCDITDTALEAAMSSAKDAGVIVVAASGNESADHVCYPASSVHSIAVGASNSSDQRASFSNYGSKLDIIAPGSGIPAATSPSKSNGDKNYDTFSGTSLATPHVAGVASGIKSIIPDASFNTVKKALTRNADTVPDMENAFRTDMYGYGRLNVYKTYSSVLKGGYGGVRLISCGSGSYIIERDIRRKRAITATGTLEWGLSDMYFNDGDSGCSYPTFSLPLDRIIRSRNTNNEYLVDEGLAHYIHSKSIADTWGIGDYESHVYPQLNDSGINFLNISQNLPSFTPSFSNANIRIYKCNSQHYLVERNIRRKRLISNEALGYWGLNNAYFPITDRGCAYPAYSLELQRVIRSRNTGKEYLIDGAKAYYIHNQEAADSWSLGDYKNTTYPQFYGKSIHFLEVVGELPPP